MRLYIRYCAIHLKSAMQHKVSFLLTTLGQFFISFNVFLGVYFMFQRFSNVKGFTFQDSLICFSIILLSYSFAEMFARGFDMFPSMISNGEFDRVLVRPRRIMFQVLASKMEFTRLARILQAIVMMIYAIPRSNIEWTPAKVIVVVNMILGGTAVFSGLFIIYACFCFFTLEGLEFMNIFTDGAREYGKYPISIYGKRILLFCTYVIPYALFQYYPFLYLTGRNDNKALILLPLAACFFLVPSLLFWKFGLSRYKSTGS